MDGDENDGDLQNDAEKYIVKLSFSELEATLSKKTGPYIDNSVKKIKNCLNLNAENIASQLGKLHGDNGEITNSQITFGLILMYALILFFDRFCTERPLCKWLDTPCRRF